MQTLMRPIDRRETYIKIPVNSFTILFVLFLIMTSALLGNWFFGKYRLRSPIIVKVQLPFEARIASKFSSGIQKVNAEEMNTKSVTATPTPQPTKKPTKQTNAGAFSDQDYINQAKHKDIVAKIYTLESSQGTQDGCKDQGKVNGFGYRQNDFEWICFDTFAEVVQHVDNWFDTQLQSKNLAEALCYYNTGKVEENCKYYQKFLSL